MLQYHFPKGTNLVINEDSFNTHNEVVRAYRGRKEFTLPVWLLDGLKKALSYNSRGKLALVYSRLPKEVRHTMPTKIYTHEGEQVCVSAGGLI
jgi:hypothetical protein